jgi:hypothetical protein
MRDALCAIRDGLGKRLPPEAVSEPRTAPYHTYVATAPTASECVTRRPAYAMLNVCVVLPSFIATST